LSKSMKTAILSFASAKLMFLGWGQTPWRTRRTRRAALSGGQPRFGALPGLSRTGRSQEKSSDSVSVPKRLNIVRFTNLHKAAGRLVRPALSRFGPG
jgi:hypothetical protein